MEARWAAGRWAVRAAERAGVNGDARWAVAPSPGYGRERRCRHRVPDGERQKV